MSTALNALTIEQAAELRVAYDATRWVRTGMSFDQAIASDYVRGFLAAWVRWHKATHVHEQHHRLRRPQLRLPL